jgi:hypothetical protein
VLHSVCLHAEILRLSWPGPSPVWQLSLCLLASQWAFDLREWLEMHCPVGRGAWRCHALHSFRGPEEAACSSVGQAQTKI